MNNKELLEIKKRETFLMESDPNEYEWDSHFNELEYFILRGISSSETSFFTKEQQEFFDELDRTNNKDLSALDDFKFEKNKFNSLEKSRIIELLDFVSLILQTATSDEISLILDKEIYYEESVENLFVYFCLDTAMDIIHSEYKIDQYFDEISAANVFSETLIPYFEGTLRNEEFSNSRVGIQLNSFYKNKWISNEEQIDYFPEKNNTGWVYCYLIDKDTKVISNDFVFWNGETFDDLPNNQLIYAWMFIEEHDINEYLRLQKGSVESFKELEIYSE